VTATLSPPARTPVGPPARGPFSVRRLHGAAIVRIAFGLLWLIDAIFKWLPGFINGQTLHDELGGASHVNVPIVHDWMLLWNGIGLANPPAFAATIAVLETLAAVSILFGAFSNVGLLGSALLSFGIWSGAEGFHLPWDRAGETDLGPSAAYWIASLALFFAAAGSTWSLDTVLRPRLGRLRFLAAPAPFGELPEK
jgi:thiosulfate dehydrogenase [quinone] large subunit